VGSTAEGRAKIGGEIARGEMPPWYYTIVDANRRLSSDEKQDLARSLAAMFGSPK
jgi:hypothetical protein